MSRVAIVTGGASGIGAALAAELVGRGARVVVADRQLDLAREVAARIGSAVAIESDVRDLGSQRALVDETIAREGRVDLFFANAGIGVAGEIDGYGPADWDDVFDVNLRGVVHGIQAVYPKMIAQGSGHIVTTASVAGLLPTPGEASYAATKHAVVGLTKVLRIEAARHGVRASALCPGAVRTPILTGGKFGRFNYEGLDLEKVLDVWKILRPMDPAVFAKKAMDAIERNEAIIVVPSWWKIGWYLERISPRASLALWSVLLGKMRKDLEAAGGRPVSRAG